MFRQWLLVSISSVTFILVWGIVLIQIYKMYEPSLPMRDVAKIERTEYVKVSEEIKVPEQTIEVTTTEPNPDREVAMKDLRLVDFSDVSSPDGVSIDDILNRLQLN